MKKAINYTKIGFNDMKGALNNMKAGLNYMKIGFNYIKGALNYTKQGLNYMKIEFNDMKRLLCISYSKPKKLVNWLIIIIL